MKLSEKAQIAVIEALADSRDGDKKGLGAAASQVIGEVTASLQDVLQGSGVPRIPAVGVAMIYIGASVLKEFDISKALADLVVASVFEGGDDAVTIRSGGSEEYSARGLGATPRRGAGGSGSTRADPGAGKES